MALRIVNKEVFGNAHLKVSVAKDALEKIKYDKESQGPIVKFIKIEYELGFLCLIHYWFKNNFELEKWRKFGSLKRI